MVTADIWPALPEKPTWIFVVCLVLIIGYFLLRAYTANQQIQIEGLRRSLDSQADRHDAQMREMRENHAKEMREMQARIDRLELVSEDARAERHFLRGEIGKYRMAMSIVDDLMGECSCGALNPIASVVKSLDLEAPAFPTRPVGEPSQPEEGI